MWTIIGFYLYHKEILCDMESAPTRCLSWLLSLPPALQMLSHGKKGLMIIRTDYFIDAVEVNDVARMEDLLKKDIEKFRLHSAHGR